MCCAPPQIREAESIEVQKVPAFYTNSGRPTDSLSVSLKDGRTITVPLAWYPKLLHASTQQRSNWKVAGGGYGIHWPDLDEDLSTEGLLRGAPAPQPPAKV